MTYFANGHTKVQTLHDYPPFIEAGDITNYVMFKLLFGTIFTRTILT